MLWPPVPSPAQDHVLEALQDLPGGQFINSNAVCCTDGVNASSAPPLHLRQRDVLRSFLDTSGNRTQSPLLADTAKEVHYQSDGWKVVYPEGLPSGA